MTNAGPGAVEQPSGKNAAGENFPVASILIARELRPHVAVFYAFARAIDDIADSPDLTSAAKIERLHGFEQALDGNSPDSGYEAGERLAESLAATQVADRHARDLIAAFKQDAVKRRYADWEELMAYCRLSAAPVGRYLIDLHGGSSAGYAASDALCAALQVINHLQDCAEDFRDLDRVYLPANWLAAAGIDASALGGSATTPPLRRVVDQCLDGCRRLMEQARPLPNGLASRRLALESAVIIEIADALIGELARRDPLAERVRLSRPASVRCAVRGCLRGFLRRR